MHEFKLLIFKLFKKEVLMFWYWYQFRTFRFSYLIQQYKLKRTMYKKNYLNNFSKIFIEIYLITIFSLQVLTLVKTCEPVAEMRTCRSPRDWSLLALQNVRTGKSHYLVICRCPYTSLLGMYRNEVFGGKSVISLK